MSASTPPQHAATPDGLDLGKGRFVLGSSGDSLIGTVVAFFEAQPAMLTITILMLAFFFYQLSGTKGSKLPIINPQPLSKKYNHANRMKLAVETKDNIITGHKKYGPDQIFKVNSVVGELIVLPPRFISEIRNDKDLLPQDATQTSVCWTHLARSGLQY